MVAPVPTATAVIGCDRADCGTSRVCEKLLTNATVSAVRAAAITAGTDSGPGRKNCCPTATAVTVTIVRIMQIRRSVDTKVDSAATASAARTVSINQVIPVMGTTPKAP